MPGQICFEAVHRLFCNLKDVPDDENAPLFGGVPAVTGGDFAQTLPIKPDRSRPDIVNMCIREPWICKRLRKLHPRKNMRVHEDKSHPHFSELRRTNSGLRIYHTRLSCMD
ncbi:hypothetical protein GcC1_087031 [Golovinomyces cichoracearum]|uniref:ATP-dependent DNA helicase n=1 Tax=Golovinomyces cichoracearum TaxID=62708 RepID=A0A420IH83_9PEZI|nr:hypothetical protein GcC1_087031 [Golovinomyces cichoracearum]